MVNINQLCEKIIQGPQSIYTKVNTDSNSAFLEILSLMSQSQAVETEVRSVDTDVGKVLFKKQENRETEEDESELLNPEMMQMVMGQIPVCFNVLDTPLKQVIQAIVVPNIQVSNINPKIVNQNEVGSDNQSVLTNVIKTDEESVFKIIEPENQVAHKKVEVVIIEPLLKNEIQKHYKVLNQTIKFKEIIKPEDSVQLNLNPIKHSEYVAKKDVELSEIDMNQFKQSLQEMKASLENISGKEDESIVFKLKPEGLAEIIIKFEQKLGKVTLDISTSNKSVEQLIQKELPHLKDALKSYHMEVNLNEMSFKEKSSQSQHFKPHQNKQVFKVEHDVIVEDEWINTGLSYGFNTYV